MKRQRGSTLVELMISTALLAVVAGTATTIALDAGREERLAQGFADDVTSLRAGLRRVETDVRAADASHVADGALVLQLRGDEVVWRLRDDGLVRATRGRQERVARTAGRFEPTVEDGVVRVVVAPRPRGNPDARPPAVSSATRLRTEVAR